LSPNNFSVQENGLKQQADILKQIIAQYNAQIEVEQRALHNGYLNAAQQAEMNKQLADTKNQLQSTIDSMKDLKNQYATLISDTLTKQKEANLQHLQDQFDKLNKQLSELVKKDESFDFGNFTDSIDSIINSLDELDGKFANNAMFETSTWNVRNNIADTKNKILDLANAVNKLTESTSNSQSGLETLIRSEAAQANQIYGQIQQIDNQIRDTTLLYKQQEDALQNQINLKQEQLNQLDQQYQMEDRIKQLNDLMTQRDQVMADKRYEIIDANGNKQLTYDVAKVADLNKQINDLNTQNARDDAKKALQDQINDMQKNLDQTKQIHQANLDQLNLYKNSLQNLYDQLNNDISKKMDALKTLQDQQITDTTKNWDDLITAVQNGTSNYTAIMNGWYAQTIADMKSWNADVATQLVQLKSAFQDMQNIQGSITVASASPFIQKLASVTSNAVNKILPKHHDGGIVGEAGNGNPVLTNLVNKLFNVKPNEQIVKALKGELMIPPKNIPNFFTNIGNLVNSLMPKTPAIVQGGDTYHLNIEKVVTEDASSFLRDLPRIIKTKKQ
jgi:cytochrome c556